MSEEKQQIKLELTIPTVFPKLNAKMGLEEGHKHTHIMIDRMKHKHFRKMQMMHEQKQIHYIMSALTGLADEDLDELDAEDSARLTEVIYGFMEKYAELAKKMLGE